MAVKTKKEALTAATPAVKELNKTFYEVEDLVNNNADGNPPVNTTAAMLSAIMEQQFSADNIEQKTELNDEQIVIFSQCETFADRYNLPLLKKITGGMMRKNVSRNRKGRIEWADIAKASFNAAYADDQERGLKSIPARLAGL